MEHLQVVIEGSGRHVHLTREDLETLFGKGFELEVKKYLSQPGEFVSNSKVDIVGPKGTLKGVSIIGPCRSKTQIELSYTDARSAGFNPPVRDSGNVEGSSGCTLIGPAGVVELDEGVIIARRHVHLTVQDAEKYGISDKEVLLVKTGGERSIIFDDVAARVGSNYATFMHVDYDEVNSGALFGNPVGTVYKKSEIVFP